MLAIAGNSLLCRLALQGHHIDAASFTAIRLASGATLLACLIAVQGSNPLRSGSWFSALALFVYAAGFSFAYLTLPAGTGALLLFGAVQATMIVCGLLRGKGAVDPARTTAGNFLRAAPMSLLLLPIGSTVSADAIGIGYAIASGALASGLGYIIWYAAVPQLRTSIAAVVQLSVPVIAAGGGLALLGEAVTWRYVLASAAILGGILLVLRGRVVAIQHEQG